MIDANKEKQSQRSTQRHIKGIWGYENQPHLKWDSKTYTKLTQRNLHLICHK